MIAEGASARARTIHGGGAHNCPTRDIFNATEAHAIRNAAITPRLPLLSLSTRGETAVVPSWEPICQIDIGRGEPAIGYITSRDKPESFSATLSMALLLTKGG